MRKFKRLNRKGFTLIELLAVIVILAVVMGVATTSVLNAMNNSRKSSLDNSAKTAADAFRTAYAEYSMNSTVGILGVTTETTIKNLLNGTVTSISSFKSALNITVGTGNSDNYLTNSAVKFDKATSTFKVCLIANPKGSYYVASAAPTAYVAPATGVSEAGAPSIKSGNLTAGTSYMWSCSDNTHSWT